MRRNLISRSAILAMLLFGSAVVAGGPFSVGTFNLIKEHEARGESAIQFKLAKIQISGRKGQVITVGFTLEQDGKTLAYGNPSRGKAYSDPYTLWHWSVYFTRSQIVAAGIKLNERIRSCVVASVGGEEIGRRCAHVTPGGTVTKPATDTPSTTTTTTTTTTGGDAVFDRAVDLSSGSSGLLFAFTDEQIKRGNRDPRIRYLRGWAHLQLLNCEASIRDLEEARRLGLREIRIAGGNDTVRLLQQANECVRRLPLREAYPSRDNYQVAVRYSSAGVHSRAARGVLADLSKVSNRLFGAPPRMIVAAIFKNEQEAEEFKDATRVDVMPGMMRKDAHGFGGDLLFLFDSRESGPARSDTAADTIVHEFIHVMDKRQRPSSRTSISTWWLEGLATLGTELHFGRGSTQVQRDWAEAYRRAGGIDKGRVLGASGGFQEEPRYIRLNYLTAALMVNTLIEKKGIAIVRKITEAQTEDARFRETIERLTGLSEDQIYEATVAAAQKSSGLNFEDQQYEPPKRSTFVNGDLVLARNSYNRDQVEFLPATFYGYRGGQASVYYLYGANSVVGRNDIVHLNWRKGVRIRCRVGEEYEDVTVQVATKKEVIYERGGRQGRAPIGSCNELGNGPRNR